MVVNSLYYNWRMFHPFLSLAIFEFWPILIWFLNEHVWSKVGHTCTALMFRIANGWENCNAPLIIICCMLLVLPANQICEAEAVWSRPACTRVYWPGLEWWVSCLARPAQGASCCWSCPWWLQAAAGHRSAQGPLVEFAGCWTRPKSRPLVTDVVSAAGKPI